MTTVLTMIRQVQCRIPRVTLFAKEFAIEINSMANDVDYNLDLLFCTFLHN